MCSSIKNAPHIVLLLVSVAATPPFMFLIVRKNFIFQPTIIPPIPSSYPGNSPVFILVPQLSPAPNPPAPIPHPLSHQSHQFPSIPRSGFSCGHISPVPIPHPLPPSNPRSGFSWCHNCYPHPPSPWSINDISTHQSLGPDLCVATFPHSLLPLPLPINPYMLSSIPIHIWDPSRPIPARPSPPASHFYQPKYGPIASASN